MAKDRSSAQQDLFDEPPQAMKLGPAERTKAMEQLQTLLMEAMASVAARLEAADE